jgi:cation diffusion facilitator CzcD-associated flavoprotein CzcO
MAASNTSQDRVSVIIIGAGVSGLAMAVELKKRFYCDDYLIYDRLGGFGGTWRANTC